jgi:hypothetical protein
LAAIDNLRVQAVFEVAPLRGRERVIEDDGFRAGLEQQLFELLHLATADARGGVRVLYLLPETTEHFEVGGL